MKIIRFPPHLHQSLQHVLKVFPELRSDGQGDVAEDGKDLRLDGSMDVVVTQVGEKDLHDLVSKGAHQTVAHGTADISH